MVKNLRILFSLMLLIIYSLQAFAQEGHSDPWESHISVPGKTGPPLIIDGKILGRDGKPIEGADLWIHHTDSEGFYAKDESGREKGWRQALYSARLKSGPDGKFKIQTIRPEGYPDSINPAHLHIRINAPGYPELEYTAYFHGGDRITDDIKELVRKYGTMFVLSVDASEDGSQTITWHITLLKNSPY